MHEEKTHEKKLEKAKPTAVWQGPESPFAPQSSAKADSRT